MSAPVSALRRTPLYQAQLEEGGRFVDFHGWELPVQFSSILREHQAVRAACGVFDVSHMGQVFVEGPQALAFLQKVNANDVGKAPPGKAVYSHVLNERGGLVDDVIVSCLTKDRYLVVVNAATQDKDFAWFQKQAMGFDVKLQNKSADYSMIALQGPNAHKVLAHLAVQAVELPRFGAMESDLYGNKTIITRTGYTGEDGFELIVPNETGVRAWQDLLTFGRSLGLVPCGLGSRDTLRLEAGLLLYGSDVDGDHTTYEANYGWVVKLDKGEFIGKDVLARQKKEGLKRRLTGFKLLVRGVPRPGATVLVDGKPLGTLSSATYAPTLGTGIGVGYMSDPSLAPGRPVTVECQGRQFAAEVAAMPFYRRNLHHG